MKASELAVEESRGPEEAAIIELSNKIIVAALAEGASDIHIEPASKESKVRFRVDGVMREVLTLPRNVHDPLITRFKVMADLDTANRKSIQVSRIHVEHGDQEYDMRETILPTIYGEKATMRVWQPHEYLVRLEQIGLSAADRERLDRCLRSPQGLLVFSGPTACGKTTTMDAALLSIVTPEKVAYSVEDPVELRLPGVIQIGVNRKLGMSHADILRGVRRADPDVIMLGDIPDVEAAELCLSLAMTGMLMMFVVHADDVGLAVHRMYCAMDPFLLSQSLVMVMCQRLVRRIHEDCKQPAEYPAEVVAQWRQRAEEGGLTWPEKPTFYRGAGCDRCLHTGYYGRMGIYEIMVMDMIAGRELVNLVATSAPAEDIRAAAVRAGMTTMLADGMAKALAGQTTVEEVLRLLATTG